MKVEKIKAHGSKLEALLTNSKLPKEDLQSVSSAIEYYNEWINKLKNCDKEGDDLLLFMVDSLNVYKNFIDIELIFQSKGDFLYRQNGQLKLSNSILEEFLPYLFDERLIPGFANIKNAVCGPQSSFSGLSFGSPLLKLNQGGVFLKKKDQDFSVAKKHTITIKDNPTSDEIFSANFCVSHFATEIKTNLDKTMFQEASQTANELKSAVPGARYLLLCEYLDMTPITTKLTSIDEVIVLRKAKRLPSNIRKDFSNVEGRNNYLDHYKGFLQDHPLSIDSFRRFIHHLNDCFPVDNSESDDTVINRGYF
ncbi:Bpu10I family restriction endonuclease [Salmonella enterica subsp. salamae]|uniref:Bpu10I family restriction endonuclease n=1 Tax=Salmonella enterica subsp. salamae TaxID=59202 RepID=A0A8F7YPY8_SALER|nr:Bpu10I family restriction endonuclease [Salmonella enterica subsp. enterica serovar Stanleyville]QXX26814.1 Bpu10I family restriction endonuclease [Salmonella enterica subsp. salamae]